MKPIIWYHGVKNDVNEDWSLEDEAYFRIFSGALWLMKLLKYFRVCNHPEFLKTITGYLNVPLLASDPIKG